MIKIGQKAIGIRFEHRTNSAGLHWNSEMESSIGREGIVTDIIDLPEEKVVRTIRPNRYFNIKFQESTEDWSGTWSYPITEYIDQMRWEKLKDLGI